MLFCVFLGVWEKLCKYFELLEDVKLHYWHENLKNHHQIRRKEYRIEWEMQNQLEAPDGTQKSVQNYFHENSYNEYNQHLANKDVFGIIDR